MPDKKIKEDINTSILSILSKDYKKIYEAGPIKMSWNNLNDEEIKKMVEEFIKIISNLSLDINILNTVPVGMVNNLNSYFRNLVTYITQFEAMDMKVLRNQHYNALNTISTINNTLRQGGIYSELKYAKGEDILIAQQEMINIRRELEKFKKSEFEEAIQLTKSLMEGRDSLEEIAFDEQKKAYNNLAQEHQTLSPIEGFNDFRKISRYREKWVWLLLALISGVLVAIIVAKFIAVATDDSVVTSGVAILRVSSVIIPSYFMVFFLNQYSRHKKIYDSYKFKDSSLTVMFYLMKSHPKLQSDILSRGLNIIFSEPFGKDSTRKKEENQMMISDLINLLKSQSAQEAN